jgi:hypothetical protein
MPLFGLVSLNDGRDKIYVTGEVTYGYDSNLFASAGGAGDSSIAATVSSEYSRRAGLIGVDAAVSLNMSRFNQYTSENFNNPKFSLEFTKQSGRTTGSLLLGAARESRADSAANIRNESWNYKAGLNMRYPVIERYSLSGGVGYSKRDFQNNTELVDLTSISTNIDLFYVYNSERDLILGYRFRRETTSASNTNYDHDVNVGISGKVLPKLNGTVRVGYQVRDAQGNTDESFSSWQASSSLTWNLAKRLTLTGALSKDFSTTSTNISTDTLSGQLSAVYTYSSKLSFGSTLSAGQSKYLGIKGQGREDFFFSYGFDINYALNEHLKLHAGYTFFQNWSTLAYSDFIRNSYTLSISSRW